MARGEQLVSRGRGAVTNNNYQAPTAKKSCFICNSDKHLARMCDQKGRQNSTYYQGRGGGHVHVNACNVKPTNDVRAEPGTMVSTGVQVARDDINASQQAECAFIQSVTNGDGDVSKVKPKESVNNELQIFPLQYVNIVIDGNIVRALNDSGAQVPVLRKSILKKIEPI